MAVSKLFNSGFGRTSNSADSSTASRYTNLPQAVVVERIPITREASSRGARLDRDSLATSTKEAMVVERVSTSLRTDCHANSPVGAGAVGVSLQEDVGASWIRPTSQSIERPILRRQLAGAVCHSGASEVASASPGYAGAATAATRSKEAATPYRLADPTQETTPSSLADVPRQWGRVWVLHSSRVAVPQQEAVVWKLLPASQRPAPSQDPSPWVRSPVADTQDKVNDRILDAVPRPLRNPRRTLQPQHTTLPTPHETT